jgi:hypothetical protein
VEFDSFIPNSRLNPMGTTASILHNITAVTEKDHIDFISSIAR